MGAGKELTLTKLRVNRAMLGTQYQSKALNTVLKLYLDLRSKIGVNIYIYIYGIFEILTQDLWGKRWKN